MIMQVLDWWSQGLAAGLAGLAKAARRPRRFDLSAEARSWLLREAGGGTEPVIRLAPDGRPPADILRRTRGSVITIVVPPAAILERHLDLPAESRPYIENIVRHQLEALFPWRAADVLHAAEVRSLGNGRVGITVRATARPAIAPAIAAATACGAREVVVADRVPADDEAGARTIPLALGSPGDRQDHHLRIARHAIAALLLLTVGVLGWTMFTRWALTTDIAQLDEAIAERRAVLKRASDARNRAAGGGLDTRKQHGVVAVDMLEALSSVLPDDTHLTDLSLDAGRVRMTGVSARATELVPLLEGSGHFRSATFYAPMTRLPGQSLDRFSIEAAAIPRAERKP